MNYGWNRMEGFHCYIPDTNCNDGTLTLPILEHDHSQGCSVTGGFVYRGSLSPQLYGVYLFGDYCSGIIWGATRDSAGVWSKRQVAFSQFISSFGEDEAGEIYVVEHSGSVRKIVGPTAYAVPAITALTPGGAVKGDPTFTLTVDGAGFTPASVVRWNGAPRTTAYVSRTRLTVSIPASDVRYRGQRDADGGQSRSRRRCVAGHDVPDHQHVRRRASVAPAPAPDRGDRAGGDHERLRRPEVLSRGRRHARPAGDPAAARPSTDRPTARRAATGTVFGDVKKADFAAAFIERTRGRGDHVGLRLGELLPGGGGDARPHGEVPAEGTRWGRPTRRGRHSAGIFSDVPPTAPFAAWIEELSRRGFTSGCAAGKFCPNLVVTRAQMAAFLARTFGIVLPP